MIFSLLEVIFLIVIIVCPVCEADDTVDVRNARNECRSLELDRDSADTETILESHVRNYIACCTLCKYQRGCTHFRWQGQGRSCELFRVFGNEDHCESSNSSCIQNSCIYPEMFVPVESAQGYICLKAQTDLGSGCSTVRDCGGGLHTECTDARCRCQIGYLHSMSQQYCVRECAFPRDVFEGYMDKRVMGLNTDGVRDVTIDECRTLCIKATFVCRHFEFRTNLNKCVMSETDWLDVDIQKKVLHAPRTAVNLRQCN